MANLRKLRICDSGTSPRICGFAICGLLNKFALPSLFICTCMIKKEEAYRAGVVEGECLADIVDERLHYDHLQHKRHRQRDGLI
jgi:hypothetical protein